MNGSTGDQPAYDKLRVRQCPGGPLLVRGATTWTDDAGVDHRVTRPVVAVCQCHKSQRQPWCDGTHKFVRSDSDPTQSDLNP